MMRKEMKTEKRVFIFVYQLIFLFYTLLFFFSRGDYTHFIFAPL